MLTARSAGRAVSFCWAEEAGFHGGEGGVEGLRGGGGEQEGAVGGVFEQPAQGADELQVVAGRRGRRAENEEQPEARAGLVGQPALAASDSRDDFPDVRGAGMRQRDAVADGGGGEAVAGEQFLKKSLVGCDVGMVAQQAGHLRQGLRALPALHPQVDAVRGQELGRTERHAGGGKSTPAAWPARGREGKAGRPSVGGRTAPGRTLAAKRDHPPGGCRIFSRRWVQRSLASALRTAME